MDESLRSATIIKFRTPNEAIVTFDNVTIDDNSLEELEADMLNEVRHCLKNDLGRSKPRLNQEVMVFNTAHTRCQRGYVLEILPTDTKTMYTVFLYDDGLVTKYAGDNILKLKERFQALLPRTNIFKIPGIMPAKLILQDIHGMALSTPYQQTYIEGEQWTPPALKQAQEWAVINNKRTRVSVRREIDRVVKVGELFAVDKKGNVFRKSYAELLCAQNLAVFNKLTYDADVKPEVQTKEDWQQRAQRIGDSLLSDVATSARAVRSPVEETPLSENKGSEEELVDESEWEALLNLEESPFFKSSSDVENIRVPMKAAMLNLDSEIFQGGMSKMRSKNIGKFSEGRDKTTNPFVRQVCTKSNDEVGASSSNSSPELNHSGNTSCPKEERPGSASNNLFSRIKNPDNCFEDIPGSDDHGAKVILLPDHINHDQQQAHRISLKDAVSGIELDVKEVVDSKIIANDHEESMTPGDLARLRKSPHSKLGETPGNEPTPMQLARKKPTSNTAKCLQRDGKLNGEPSAAARRGGHENPSQLTTKSSQQRFGCGKSRNPFKQSWIPQEHAEQVPVHHKSYDQNTSTSPLTPTASPKPPFEVTLPYTWDEVISLHSISSRSASRSSEDSQSVPSADSSGRTTVGPSRLNLTPSPKLNSVHSPNQEPAPRTPHSSPLLSHNSRQVADNNIEKVPLSHAATNVESSRPGQIKRVSPKYLSTDESEFSGQFAKDPRAIHNTASKIGGETSATASVADHKVISGSVNSKHDGSGSERVIWKPLPTLCKEDVGSSESSGRSSVSKGESCESVRDRRSPRNSEHPTEVAGTSRRVSNEKFKPTSGIPVTENSVDRLQSVTSFSYEGANLQRMMKNRVFVYGQSPVPPYSCLEEFPYLKVIKFALKNLLGKFNALQKNVVPNILRGRNMFILDNPGSGKSLSYMIPIVSKIMVEGHTMCKDNRGPVAVFLASSLASGLQLNDHMQFLLDSVNLKETVGYCITQNDQKTKLDLKRGIDIMITTPELVQEMIVNYLPYFKLDRLMYLVVDDVEVLTNTKIKVLADVLKHIENDLKKLAPRACPFQTIFVGNSWSDEIENATHIVSDPVIVCGPIQATVFAGVKTVVHFSQNEEEKVHQLLDVIGKIIATPTVNNKVVIASQSNDAINLIHDEILEKFHFSVDRAMHSNPADDDAFMSPGHIEGVRQRWKTSRPNNLEIIACTDDVIKDLQITDALQLIHFDVPENPSRYAQRYCTMWSRFRSPQHREENGSNVKEIVTNLFLTSEQKDLLLVVRKLKEQNCQIPMDLEAHFQKLRKEETTRSRLCPGLIWHGLCEQLDPVTCMHRHEALPDDDDPSPMIPKTGQIEVRITEALNPSSYYAQLLRHFEVSGGTSKLIYDYEKDLVARSRFLEEYYKEEKNRRRPKRVEKDVFVAAEADGKYVRAQVDAIVTKNEFNFPTAVALFCLDTATVITRYVDQDEIYVLPDEYENLPAFGFELVLANMKPPSGERCYRRDHITKARQLASDAILVGRICLSSGNRVWVDQLVEMATNEEGKTYQKRSLRQEYFRLKYAENNLEHMETLYKLFREVGISCKEYDDLKAPSFDLEFASTFFQLGEPVQWAHIDVSCKENLQVVTLWSSYIEYLDFIFCYHEKYTPQLDRLHDELNEEIEKFRETKKISHPSALQKYYKAGMIVAAKDNEDTWSRAMIRFVDAEESDILYDIFYVDSGEEKLDASINDLFPIPKKFVSSLPFQAIALKMEHITPLSVEGDGEEGSRVWGKEAQDLIWDKLLHEGSAQKLKVVVFSRNESTEYYPCKYYNAIIFSLRDGDPYEAGELLVIENKASFTKDGEELLSLVKQKMLKEANDTYDEYVMDKEGITCGSGDSQVVQYNSLGGPDLSDNEDLWNPDNWDCYYGENDPLKQFVGENSHFDEYTKDAVKSLAISYPLDHSASNSQQSAASTSQGTMSSTSNIDDTLPPPLKLTESEVGGDALGPNLLKPQTVWKQSNDEVILRINIADIKNFKAEVSQDRKSFCFETINPPGYGFHLRLYKKIEREFDAKLLGSCTKIKFKKRLATLDWTRLTESETKPRWVTRDYDDISSGSEEDLGGSSSDEENERSQHVPPTGAAKQKRKSRRKQTFASVNYSHSDSSDSDYLQEDDDGLDQILE